MAVGELHFDGNGESVLSRNPNQLRAMDHFPAHYGVYNRIRRTGSGSLNTRRGKSSSIVETVFRCLQQPKAYWSP